MEHAMAFVPVPGAVRTTLRFTSNGLFAGTNTIHYRTATSDPADADMIDDLDTYIQDVFTELGPDAYAAGIDGCAATYRALDEEESILVGPSALDPSGTVAGAFAAQNGTFCVKFGTGFSGRSYRGRIYHVGALETQISNGKMLVPDAEAIIAFWGKMMTGPDLLAIGFYGAVVSYQHNGVVLATGVPTVVTSVGYTTLGMRTQRGRADLFL